MTRRFDTLDAWLLLASACSTGLYFFDRGEVVFLIPGIGGTLSFLLIFFLTVFVLYKRQKLVVSREGIFLSAQSVLLSLPYAILGQSFLLFFTIPVLGAVSVQALLSLAGRSLRLTVRGLFDGFSVFFHGMFRNIGVPFRVLGRYGRRIITVLAGFMIGIPIIVAAAALLGSADVMFDAWLSGISQRIISVDWSVVYRLLKMLIMTALLFSFLYELSAEMKPPKEASSLRLPASLFPMTLFTLSVIYAVFGYLQFRYLFLGQDASLMQGGFAPYARRGFFQLVGVSFITLSLVLFTLHVSPSPLNRELCAVVSLLTLIIAVSAGWRMVMYVEVYGLTLLRVVTFWGIAMIMIALLLAILKCLGVRFNLCPALLVIWLIGWTALQYANVDRWIAQYNVNAYLNGSLAELDAGYLADLSPSVLAAFDRDEERLAPYRARICQSLARQKPQSWYDWSIVWLRLPD